MFLIFLIVFSIIPVNAFSYATITGIGTQEGYSHQNPENNVIYHYYSGKFLYVKSYNNATIHLWIYYGLTQQAKITITGIGTGNVRMVMLAVLNSTHALLYYNQQHSIGTHKAQVILVNVYAYTTSAYTTTTDPNLTIYGSDQYGGVHFVYNSDHYFITAFEDGSSNYKLLVVKFVVSTHTATQTIITIGAAITAWSYVYGFQDNSTQYAYLVVGYNTASRPNVVRLDLSALTLSVLANGGSDDNFGVSRQMHFIGGGIVQSGTLYYVVFTYVYGKYATYREVQIRQYRTVYNNTITAGSLIAQNIRSGVIYPNYLTHTSDAVVSGGYLINNNLANFEIDYVTYYDSTYHIERASFTVPDFLDYSSTSITLDSTEEVDDEIPYYSSDAVYCRTYDSPQLALEVSASTTQIYADLEELDVTWYVSVSQTPNDDPLKMQTSYTFNCQVTKNYVGTQVTVKLTIDGVTQFVKKTEVNGVFDFSFASSDSVTLTFKIWVYDDNILVTTHEWTVTVGSDYDPSDVPASDVLIISTNTIIASLPLLALLGIPTFTLGLIGYKTGFGIIGFIMGLALGTAIAAVSGLIPFYITILIGLVIVAAFVMILKTHGSG